MNNHGCNNASLLNAFSGLPFLDDSFRHMDVLTAVAGIRFQLGQKWLGIERPLVEWLHPDVAYELRYKMGIRCNLEFTPLGQDHQSRVDEAVDSVVRHMPGWSVLVTMPSYFHAMSRPGVKSCSCYATPQRIFLSREVLDDKRRLIEAIVHEYCHNWMYMLEELSPFHISSSSQTFVLPSGTSDRNATEVIGAGHVSAVLYRWYGQFMDPISAERQRALRSYALGCIQVLRDMNDSVLLAAGNELRDYLVRRVRLISQEVEHV